MRKLSLVLLAVALSVGAFAQKPAQEQARQQFENHNYRQAAELYRAVVSSEPDNAEALAGLVDSLDALGKWRDALPILEHLVALQPTNAARNNQLGRWRSWSGERSGALKALELACSKDNKNPQYCTDYAAVLGWHAESRGPAVAQLRSVLSSSPNYVPALVQLAEILSWGKGERQEAMGLFDRALAIEPANTRALAGKAQLLAWSGHSSQAIELYNQVLQADPNNVAALRGKAQILNWRGNYPEAYESLRRAQPYAPDDLQLRAELARAQVGLQHYGEAHRIVSDLPAWPDFDAVRQETLRAAGRWTEIGVAFRRNASNLNYDQLSVATSTLVGSSNRVVFRYTPTLYSTHGHDFNSNSYGAELESRVNDRLALRTVVAGDTYPGAPSEITGGLQAQYRLGPSVRFHSGFDRSPVDESLVSLRGIETPGGFTGQVTSNLFNAGASYSNRKHGYDGSLTYTDGVYTGSRLDTNRRWAVEGNFGKSVASTPYIRVAYGFAYAQFQYDADAPAPLPTRAGGYFSPTRYLLNYGGVTVSHKFGQRVEIEANGTAGAQNVENTTSSFGNAAFAGTFSGRLLWRLNARNEVRIRYDYLNVFNAFHRHLPGVSWRYYF